MYVFKYVFMYHRLWTFFRIMVFSISFNIFVQTTKWVKKLWTTRYIFFVPCEPGHMPSQVGYVFILYCMMKKSIYSIYVTIGVKITPCIKIVYSKTRQQTIFIHMTVRHIIANESHNKPVENAYSTSIMPIKLLILVS